MKVRKGFVSNSSTSSFVVFGIELTDEQYDEVEKDFGCGDGYISLCGVEDGIDEGKIVIGKMIAGGDETDFRGDKLNIKDLQDWQNEIQLKLASSTPCKIYSGIRMA